MHIAKETELPVKVFRPEEEKLALAWRWVRIERGGALWPIVSIR